MSLKYLIAAANAKRQAKQMPPGGDHIGNASDKVGTGPASSPSPIQGRGSSGLVSPVQPVQSVVVIPQEAPKGPYIDFMSPNGGKGEAPRSVGRNGKEKVTGGQPSGSREGGYGAESTEAAVARDTFTGMLETLSRTKESIGRASHHALECVKHGIAEQVRLSFRQSWRFLVVMHGVCRVGIILDVLTQMYPSRPHKCVPWGAPVAAFCLVKSLMAWCSSLIPSVSLDLRVCAVSVLIYASLGVLQIVEIIVEKLENEPSFHRRVDLFFLVDSITQCSHSSKGMLAIS